MCKRLCVLWAAALLALPAAGAHSFRECQEGADFIRNAALGRDAGLSGEAFLARMQEDFVAVRAFPRALRWFVQDEADEAFLLAAAREVFDAPALPSAHESGFLAACAARSLQAATSPSR